MSIFVCTGCSFLFLLHFPVFFGDVCARGEEISLHFWNISGKAVFTDIAREFFKESDAVVLVFDVTSRSSFESLPRWLDLLQPYLDDHRFSLFLCGNKVRPPPLHHTKATNTPPSPPPRSQLAGKKTPKT